MNLIKKILKSLKLNESTISMVLGFLVVIMVGALVINYFRNVRSTKVTKEETSVIETTEEIRLENLPATYTVKAGDNLWKIAENIFGSGYNWIDIAKENNLTKPNLIVVGQELNIPKAEVHQPLANAPETLFGEAISGDSYNVVKGDHLWGIAVRAYGDGYQWVKIARENNLTHPSLIHPGNILKLPR